jgi:hypothetical protein
MFDLSVWEIRLRIYHFHAPWIARLSEWRGWFWGQPFPIVVSFRCLAVGEDGKDQDVRHLCVPKMFGWLHELAVSQIGGRYPQSIQ